MKLQTRTNFNYLIFSAIIFIIVAGGFYVAVEYVIYEEVDRRLLVEKGDFEHFIQRNGIWDESCYFVEDKINVRPADLKNEILFKDTLLLGRFGSEFVPFRQVDFDQSIGNQLYRVSIRKSLIESKQLLKIITIVMIVVLCAGLSLLYWFQQITSKRLWQPFYNTLFKAKLFDVNKGEKITLPSQEIYEFNELNSSLNKMTDKILNDYQALREFTENASHEIQTPLALINSRVEGLIQEPGISNKQMTWIQDIHESTMRLSKLNQALLLLTKIENGQFYDTTLVDFRPMLEKQLLEMDELFALKSIRVSIDVRDSFKVNMNASLADLLLLNVLNNAVKHNLASNGTISIVSTASSLSVSNTGEPLTVDPNKLFERFQKQNKTSSSLGLGLAIVKKICEISGLTLRYEYSDEKHTISIVES